MMRFNLKCIRKGKEKNPKTKNKPLGEFVEEKKVKSGSCLFLPSCTA